jgi:hypothetical protein
MPDVATRCDPVGSYPNLPSSLPNVSTLVMISQGVHSIARDVNQATGSWGIAIIVPDACIRSHLCSHPNHRESPKFLLLAAARGLEPLWCEHPAPIPIRLSACHLVTYQWLRSRFSHPNQ